MSTVLNQQETLLVIQGVSGVNWEESEEPADSKIRYLNIFLMNSVIV